MDIEALLQEFDRKKIQLAKCNVKSSGGGKDEAAYGSAYTRLVQAGVRAKLKKKYR